MSVTLAVELLLALLSKTSEIAALIAAAKADGREEFTQDEWLRITTADDAARARLVEAIRKAEEPSDPVL